MAAVLTAEQFAEAYNLTPSPTGLDATLCGATYNTGYNERWDNLAYLIYGDPTQVTTLIQMNPAVAIACQLPQGTKIIICQIAPPQPPASSTPWQP